MLFRRHVFPPLRLASQRFNHELLQPLVSSPGSHPVSLVAAERTCGPSHPHTSPFQPVCAVGLSSRFKIGSCPPAIALSFATKFVTVHCPPQSYGAQLRPIEPSLLSTPSVPDLGVRWLRQFISGSLSCFESVTQAFTGSFTSRCDRQALCYEAL